MRAFAEKHIWLVVAASAMVLLVAHSTGKFSLQVDTTSLLLLAVILVSPFVSSLKKIKVGDFEAEIDPKEVRKVKDQATSLEDTGRANPEWKEPDVVEQIRDLAERDHVLGLAKLRIELERTLGRLYRTSREDHATGSKRRAPGLRTIVRSLAAGSVLPDSFTEPLERVISICNRAVHGEEIRYQDAATIIEVGSTLLERLHALLSEAVSAPQEELPIDSAEVRRLMNARYRVTTVVPLVTNPVRNIRVLHQEGLDDLLEGYNEYGEFIVRVEPVDEEPSA